MNTPTFEHLSGLGDDTYIEQEINGSLVKFWPVSPRFLPKFSAVTSTVMPLVLEILGQDRTALTEQGTEVKVTENSNNGIKTTEERAQAISVEMSKEYSSRRLAQRAKAIKALLDERAMDDVMQLCMDSARELFPERPEGGWKQAQARAALDKITIPLFFRLVLGAFSANMQSFDPKTQETLKGKVLGALDVEIPEAPED